MRQITPTERKLPQLCCSCGNKSRKGFLRSPDEGRFMAGFTAWKCMDCSGKHLQAHGRSPWEKDVDTVLKQLRIRYEMNVHFGPYYFDLYFPGLQLFIEIDSNWHRGKSKSIRDIKKDSYAHLRGFRVRRIDGSKAAPFHVMRIVTCRERVINVHSKKSRLINSVIRHVEKPENVANPPKLPFSN